MGDVSNLSQARAEKASDSRLWGAEEMLEDLLERIRSGKDRPKEIIVHWLEPTESGGSQYHYQVAGVTYPTHIALLNVALRRCLDEWASGGDR